MNIFECFFLNLYFQCVKGLVFSDVSRIKLDINAQNERGDTPLHLAAKWGYGKFYFEIQTRLESLFSCLYCLWFWSSLKIAWADISPFYLHCKIIEKNNTGSDENLDFSLTGNMKKKKKICSQT